MLGEFELIRRYFTRPARSVTLGIGDDAALLRASSGMELAISTDMLLQGTHFFAGDDPGRLGHKALAVNLSDLAAMGARPRWAFLAIALPRVDQRWLRAFSRGFIGLARRHGVDLVGGDTTRGPLNVCVTIVGEVPRGRALRRDGARTRDDIWVSGRLGDAALAVAHRKRRLRLTRTELARCQRALELPQPRIALGIALRGIAHSALDISDGLLADLGHICERSGLGAAVRIEAIPRSPLVQRMLASSAGGEALLAGGDDYELCFTAAPAARARIDALGARLGLLLTRIGTMQRGRRVRLIDPDGREIDAGKRGFDHFG
jgi:thiamine-monophosphate kinase